MIRVAEQDPLECTDVRNRSVQLPVEQFPLRSKPETKLWGKLIVT